MPKLKVVMPDDEPDNAGEPRAEELRLLEAMLFASAEPLDEASLAERSLLRTLLYRRANGVPPFRPTAVVVSDLVVA